MGVLPGAGSTIASFLAYGMERNFVKDEEKQKFGKGSVNGLSAPETANNAACSGSFVPLLTLGIPGSGTTAVMLGALLGFGIQPGPRLYQTNPEIFWSKFWDFSNIIGDKGSEILIKDKIFNKSKFFPNSKINYCENTHLHLLIALLQQHIYL